MILFQLLYLCPFRGREQHSIHNRAAYTKRCAQTTVDTCRRLPPELITLATAPLPDSHLFHEALSSGDALDESELQFWESGPPFAQPEPADTAQELRFTINLTHVFLGQKSRLENHAKARRKYRYAAGDLEKVMAELQATAVRAFQEWVRVKNCVAAECTARRHREMAEAVLRWHARIAYSYYQEVGALERGEDPY